MANHVGETIGTMDRNECFRHSPVHCGFVSRRNEGAKIAIQTAWNTALDWSHPMFLGVTFWSKGKTEFENYILVKTPHVPWESQLLHWSHLKQRNPISLLEGVADCDVYRVFDPHSLPQMFKPLPSPHDHTQQDEFCTYPTPWAPQNLHVGRFLGGGFRCFLFSPLFGEDVQFDEHMFQRGWFNHQPVFYGK